MPQRSRKKLLRPRLLSGVSAVLLVGLSIVRSATVAQAQTSTSSTSCPSKQRIVVGTSNISEVKAAWQPATNLVDNQANADTNTRPWEFSIWSPGYPFEAIAEITLDSPTNIEGIYLVSPTFGNASGSLSVSFDAASPRDAYIASPGQSRFTAMAGTPKTIRITRNNPQANVAELIMCSGGGVGPTTTTTPGPVTGCVGDPNPVGNPGEAVTVCLPFPSANRAYKVKAVEASYGTSAPPNGAAIIGPIWSPANGDCPTTEHDKYWTKAPDGKYYRTWHPSSIGWCSFGHDHGDDPRSSMLYVWSGGVPFGYANELYGEREEDHVGHKITVQNSWEAVTANGANANFSEPAKSAGFTCHWLSHIHQGTHSPDALNQNAHEYHVNVACDDGQARHPVNPQWETRSGPNNNTEVSVKLLAAFGEPGSFKACAGREIVVPNGTVGGLSSLGNDTHRVIPCIDAIKSPATALGPTGTVSREDGTEELWRPGAILFNGATHALKINAYYQVWDPIRIYNFEGRDFGIDSDGDGQPDKVMYTIDICSTQKGRDYVKLEKYSNLCETLAPELLAAPVAERWKHPKSPFRGLKRSVHPKGVTLDNATGPEFRCTGATGRGQYVDAITNADGTHSCPSPGTQILQRMAQTNNLWNYPSRALWGTATSPSPIGIQGSAINRRNDGRAAGYGFEWVRFGTDQGVHAPN
jgi:hypothetical protein